MARRPVRVRGGAGGGVGRLPHAPDHGRRRSGGRLCIRMVPHRWIMFASVFVYDISVESGQFEIIKKSISGISWDRRLQVLLIAFALAPSRRRRRRWRARGGVRAMMIGLGFPPMQTALICLIGKFGAGGLRGLGNPVRTLVR